MFIGGVMDIDEFEDMFMEFIFVIGGFLFKGVFNVGFVLGC